MRRIASTDEAETNHVIGTAQDWIEIPDLSKTSLALSSLIISERLPGPIATTTSGDGVTVGQKALSVDHRFHLNSALQFLLFIYSAPGSPVKPDVAVQVHVMRDNEPVITTSSRKVSTEGIPDLTRLVYAAEISLEHLPAGRYLLKVTAIDRATGRTAAQQTHFQIE